MGRLEGWWVFLAVKLVQVGEGAMLESFHLDRIDMVVGNVIVRDCSFVFFLLLRVMYSSVKKSFITLGSHALPLPSSVIRRKDHSFPLLPLVQHPFL